MVMNRTLSTDVITDATVAAEVEEVIATLTGFATNAADTEIALSAWAAFTTGTLATAAQLRIRRDSLTGTVVADSGDVTAGIAASAPTSMPISGTDNIPPSGQRSYVLTLQTTGAGTDITVTAVNMSGNYTP